MRKPFWCWVNGGHLYNARTRVRFDDEFWQPWIDTCIYCGHERKVKHG